MGWGQAGVSGTVCLQGGPPQPLGQVGRGDSRVQSLGTQHTKGFCVAELQAPLHGQAGCPRTQSLSYTPTGESPSQSNESAAWTFRAQIKLLQFIYIACLNSAQVLNIHGDFDWTILSLPFQRFVYLRGRTGYWWKVWSLRARLPGSGLPLTIY